MKRYIVALCTLVMVVMVGLVVSGSAVEPTSPADADTPGGTAAALFGGGCFWCMEKPFERIDGVVSVISGYAGGTTREPTYKDYGGGGHIEVVRISYDPNKVTYRQLLDTFWRQIDPTDDGGQFVDRGHGYTSVIFYYTEQQKQTAQRSKEQLAASKIFSKPLVTPILPAPQFWPAESYHQDYYKKNPVRYHFYRSGSGRDRFLDRVWENKGFQTE